MKKIKYFFILIILLIIIISVVFYFKKNESIKINGEVIKIEKRIINGGSMFPLYKEGQEVTLLDNYYQKSKSEPNNNDIVIYDFKGSKNPVIKRVIATDKDIVFIKNNYLYVNNVKVINSNGREYKFNRNHLKMLSLYIKNGHIPNDTVFIFADNVEMKNPYDSRKFGAVSINDILAKVK